MAVWKNDCLEFIVEHRGRPETAAISREALCDLGGLQRSSATLQELDDVLEAHRALIEDCARDMLDRGAFSAAGLLIEGRHLQEFRERRRS